MKTKHIMAVGALGFSVGIGLSCIAETIIPEPSVAPDAPATSVWDGSEYVGEVDGKYYYYDPSARPNGTWLALDPTRQQRFEEWQKNNPGNTPSEQPGQIGDTNAIEQAGQFQNTGPQPPGTGQNPNEQTNETGNTSDLSPPAKGQNAMEQSGNQGPEMGPSSGEQTNQAGSTRSQGPAKGLNASEQSGQIQNTRSGGQVHEMEQGPTWNNPSAEPSGIRNTRYEGHDMGQTHPVAPPLETH